MSSSLGDWLIIIPILIKRVRCLSGIPEVLPKHEIAELLQVDEREFLVQIFHSPSCTNAGLCKDPRF